MFTLPELPYPTNALEPFIDTQTMEIHHGKHHAAYVKNLNDLLPDQDNSSLLSILSNDPPTKVKNNAGGVLNHTMYWNWMNPAKTTPNSSVSELINRDFGSQDIFKEKLLSAALGHFGSGWAWLISDKGKSSIITTPNQDTPVSQGLNPVLGVDVWEHAYYLKYQNRRTDYLQAWWNVINWSALSV